MVTTRLSRKGQIIIPKSIRESQNWQTGQELMVLDTVDGVLLAARPAFAQTTLHHVAGCPSKKDFEKTETSIDAALGSAASRDKASSQNDQPSGSGD